jgi:FAD/FMN-containing dehydrogenase
MGLSRREFLALAIAAACGRTPRPDDDPPGPVLNDVHSGLNPTRVARVVRPETLAELQSAIRDATRSGHAVSVAGGRHAMGGQQFGTGTVNLDTRALARVVHLDRERGLVDVEAGIQWPELVARLEELQAGDPAPWGIVQKQTGADRFTIAGSISANGHGRGLTLPPLVGEVEALTLVDARGDVVRADRRENPELFGLAVGGYGLFGAIATVTLRLRRRQKIERVVELLDASELEAAFARRIAAGFLYGDFQFDVDAASPRFLARGVFSCYRPAPPSTPMRGAQAELAADDWGRLIVLAHGDKSRAFDEYARYYLATNGQLYYSDTHQMSVYLDGYHRALDARVGARVPGSEMITEVYVPREQLALFLRDAAIALRAARADVVYGTVRLIERDTETFLPWAREPWACIVFNLHVDHDDAGVEAARRRFRLLIDLAERRGGSYFLTYHRWATREQTLAGYPRLPEMLRQKRRWDPAEVFQSDWYRHVRAMFA